ncbi:DNA methyltransferase [Microbacterium sp. NPDC008134]|uniref:DNA methyltransferase n=1 Tax=Microbacterium sp. NPDC008134 TaxID=3364183 RepID=UPI0036E4FA67
MTNAPVDVLRKRLTEFAAWREEHLTGDEKGQSQVFLDRLFQALGWPGVFEAGATLEYRVTKTTGGTSFADLLWKPRVLIEMKRSGTKLARHLSQAFDYWVRAVPDRPRYVILCNFDELWIYDFDHQLDAPIEMLRLTDLSTRWEALGFMLPEEVRPQFGNDLVAVTREAAAEVAKVYRSLRARGVESKDVQRFTLQCVMAMFAEDTGLLPEHSFTKALADATTGAEAYDLIGGLFNEMNTPGKTPGGRFKGTPYFNGGLFSKVVPLELTTAELKLLRHAAGTEWSQVRPEIFGTLFEGSMDAGERHATGAHFTSQADIQRIIQPVIVRPWRDRIDAATNIPQLEAILGEMSQFRVLDPAVGSGNFLYIAYRELRRLEREVIERIRERRQASGLATQESFGYVTPEQFFGMDVNPFAVEVAKVTLLLGKKLADDELEEAGQTLPLDNLDKNILHADALFEEWPKADAIIGNPPFIGRRKMVLELGADYNARLDEAYGPKGVSDFVTYWFPKAHDHLPEGGRAGLVATKSVKHGDGRKASLDYIVDNGGAIIEAVSSMQWSGEAAVTVAVVNWQKGGSLPGKRTLWLDLEEPPLELDEITSALSPEVNVRDAKDLRVNAGGVYQGQTLGITDAFRIDTVAARRIKKIEPSSSEVVHPVLGGKELLQKTSVETWVIDVPDVSADEAWRKHPKLMQSLTISALPTREEKAATERERNDIALARNPKARVNRHHAGFLERWWMLGWRREDYLAATTELPRYIGLTRVSSELRGPVFSFVSGEFHITDAMVAFPYSDDYSFGILQSTAHETWFRARCTTLETRLRYTTEAVFSSFPWPQNPSQEAVDQVSIAARKIVEHCAHAFKLGQPLAAQFDVLRRPGASTLRALREELDSAVLAAYGFSAEEDLLTQLFEANLLVATREEVGEEVTPPGPRPTDAKPSDWMWPAPTL